MIIPDPAVDMPGNPYADLAYYAAELVPSNQEPAWDAAVARAFATLALAHEQRTATLVHALLSDSLVTDGRYDEIQEEVRARLGLNGDTP